MKQASTPVTDIETSARPGRKRAQAPGELGFTRPTAADASEVHRLISICKPLDLNSTYAYLLLCHHFSDTCVIARAEETIAGFVSGYVLPKDPQTFFVWQVAVHPDARGTRLGARMLRHLLGRKSVAATRFLETTVSPSNQASRRMFQRLADSMAAPVKERMLFDRAAFGNEDHEEEVLLKIGPLNTAEPGKETL